MDRDMDYWPGTNIKRSTGNAFDWRSTKSKITNSHEFRVSQAAMLNSASRGTDKGTTFTIYSKAKPSA